MPNICEMLEKLVLLVTPTTLFSVDNHHETLAHELAHTSIPHTDSVAIGYLKLWLVASKEVKLYTVDWVF